MRLRNLAPYFLELAPAAIYLPLVPQCASLFFASLGLILVAVTFFWYGQEKRPPNPQLLSAETRAAEAARPPQHKHTVAFSVWDDQGQDGTQDTQCW